MSTVTYALTSAPAVAGASTLTATPISAMITQGALHLNARQPTSTTQVNEVPLSLIAGTLLAVTSDVAGAILWSVEIE